MEYPSIRVVFDRKKVASKTKKGLVQIEVLSERRRKFISTGVKVYQNEWNRDRYVVQRLDSIQLNKTIRLMVDEIQEWVNELRANREPFDFVKFDNFLTSKAYSDNFLEFLEKQISERKDITDGTRRSHKVLLNSLKEYGRITYFSDLTRLAVQQYDKWLHNRGFKQSYIHAHHKKLKVYINVAIQMDLIKDNPYASMKIERGKSEPRKYLSASELRKLQDAEFKNPATGRYRDLFVFQCYTGLAYADLARFDFTKVEERKGRFILHDVRKKSGEDYYIVLLSPAMEILRKYDFKLPICSNQKYNDYLKDVAAEAGLERNLTSHMGRHTFAVYCLNNEIPIEILAKMLGHADIKTTQIYAKIANTTIEAAFSHLESKLAGQ